MTRQWDRTSETGGVALKCTGTAAVSSLWGRIMGSVAQAAGMYFFAVAWTPRGVQDRGGLASLVCSCCYPGNGPSGLQGLITFLKVFRSCEFWNDYIKVAVWGQGPTRVIPGLRRRASYKTPAKQRRKCSLWFRKTLGLQDHSCQMGNFYASFCVSDSNSLRCFSRMGTGVHVRIL